MLAAIVENAAAYGLDLEGEADLREATETALSETTAESPDLRKIRRSISVVKGLLAPILAGGSTSAIHGTTELARLTISTLTAAFTS